MCWFGLEPMVPYHPRESLQLVVAGKFPALQEFVARRLVTGDAQVGEFSEVLRYAEWNRTIQTVARGFRASNVGEGGVVFHNVFRNATAVQTHPLDRKTACTLNARKLSIPTGKTTTLTMRVSHHPHGDWQLRVVADGKVLAEQIVGPHTVAGDEWLDVTVDLSEFAGRSINVSIEHRANNWRNEWAYWNKVSINSE